MALLTGALLLTSTPSPGAGTDGGEFSSRFLSTSDGLQHSNVDGLFRDRRGFVWISFFGGGLSRYGGENSIMNFHAEHNGGGLRSDYVTESCEDRFGRIWIAETQGLDILSYKDFSILPVPENIRKSTEGNNCNFITEDNVGCIWYATQNGLYRVSFTPGGNIDRLDSLDCGTESGNLRMKFRDLDGDGTMYTSLEGSIYKVRYRKGEGLAKTPVLPGLYLGDGNNASDFLKAGNEIWIGSGNGLFRYDILTGKVKEYHASRRDGDLSSDQVTELAVSPDGRILVGTLKGLNIYNPLTDSFTCVNAIPDSDGNKVLADDMIRSLLVVGDQIWVGSELEGISILNTKRLDISNIHHRENDANALSDSPVSALFIDSGGRHWIGTLKSGLYLQKGGDPHAFTNFNTSNSGLCHNSVMAFDEDDQGRLWIGEREGGLNCIDLKRPDVIKTVPVITMSPEEKIDNINALEYDMANGLLWISTRSGLYSYKPETGKAMRFAEGSRYQFFSSCKDRMGRIWFGCAKGILCLDTKTLKSHMITGLGPCFSICIDEDGILWVGSFGRGVYHSTKALSSIEEAEFTLIDSRHGLSDDKIRAVTASGHYLWVTTENGLSRIDTDNGIIETFSTYDGLKSMRFSNNAAITDEDGTIYLGHRKGFSVIRPSEVKPAPEDKTVLRFTQAEVGGEVLNLSYEDTIKFHERESGFSFSFEDLSYDSYGKNYYYCIPEVDGKWQEVHSNNKRVRYEYLPSGEYTLLIRAEGSGGRILDEDKRDVIVTPYFYKTRWFILLSVALLAASLITIINIRTRNVLRQKQLLQQEVERQTRLLLEQKRELEDKTRELTEQNRLLIKLNEELASRKMIVNLGSEHVEKKKNAGFIDKLMDKLRLLYKNPDLDVDTLCKAMGMSRSVLNKKIQEAFGQPINQFIRTYRLNIAKEVLGSGRSRMNISELAYDIGFNDPKYFTRCFTKEFGFAPSAMANGKEPDGQESGQHGS